MEYWSFWRSFWRLFLFRGRLFLRKGLMFAALHLYFTTRKLVHEANHFDFHPIRESSRVVFGNFCHDDAGSGLVQANARTNLALIPRPVWFIWTSRHALERIGQCADLI